MNNFKRFKYTFTLNNGELHLSGESIYDEPQNIKPISFELMYKNYIDERNVIGKQVI